MRHKIYGHSRFIENVTPDYVDFHAPAGASLYFLVTPREYWNTRRLRWIGRHIPRSDATSIGSLLARLSRAQLRDAFRAAGSAAPNLGIPRPVTDPAVDAMIAVALSWSKVIPGTV